MRPIIPPSLHPPFGNYAHGVEVPAGARILISSGQLAITADGQIPDGAEAQADLIFSNLDAILAEGGMARADVLRLAAFVTDRAQFAPYMAARDRWLDGTGVVPASTLVIVSGFTRPEFLVEIELWAAK